MKLRNLTTIPTIGFNVETFTHGRKATLLDLEIFGRDVKFLYSKTIYIVLGDMLFDKNCC